ncbi:MAG: hypothetical protein H0T92_22915 [Pyrinomonadaceae bacterium]|nr:hypothetical protein [Pyrinomonadaceae bacterium]
MMSKNLQYITNEEGQKTAVILPIEDYEELMEDLHLSRVARESRNEERIPWEQIKDELVSEGKLDD